MADPPPALTSDALLAGRYRLAELLARGGMAEVWEAEDTVLGRPVAVKALLPHLAEDAAFVERFRREAVAAARLSHPNIVGLYDTCAGPDCEAIVMELVRGETLRDRLDRGALEPAEVVRVGADVAAALDHAHRAGLVHRDVKPGNILLAEDGRVLVTDFGIAKAAEAAEADGDLTELGQVLGTAKYLAPEQVEGAAVDRRTDVYALGVVLYEMACGRPPFDGGSSTATAVARLTRDPLRPRQVRAGVPRALEDVILRAMARRPGDRYPDAGELHRALVRLDLEADPGDPTELRRADPDATRSHQVAPASFAASERTWLVPAALILVVALTLGVVGVLVGGTDVGRDLFDAVSGDDGAAPVPLGLELRTFDPPPGGGEENDHLLPLAADGDATTVWRTDQYRSRRLGGLKDGVGVVVAPREPASLARLELTSPTPGWRAEVYVAERAATSLVGWGEPMTVVEGDRSTSSVELGGRPGAVLLWITDLGEAGRFDLAEVKLYG